MVSGFTGVRRPVPGSTPGPPKVMSGPVYSVPSDKWATALNCRVLPMVILWGPAGVTRTSSTTGAWVVSSRGASQAKKPKTEQARIKSIRFIFHIFKNLTSIKKNFYMII
jgi:replication-associated recombination protein RarA